MRFLLLLLFAACGFDAVSETVESIETPWQRCAIFDGLNGADGSDEADVDGDGDLDIVSPYEEAARVVVALNPGLPAPCAPWPVVILDGGIGLAEDAKFRDVDGDGRLDVVAASESRKLIVYFAPPRDQIATAAAWTPVAIAAASGVSRWIQLDTADFDGDKLLDIAAGGRLYPDQQIAWFSSTTPRDGASWVKHPVDLCGHTMSLVAMDVDRDGDPDLVTSDMTYTGPSTAKDPTRVGSRWLENTGAGAAWASHTINRPVQKGDPKFLHATPWRVIDGSSDNIRIPGFLTIRTSRDWLTWTALSVTLPADLGQYQDVEPGDIDRDGIEDLVFTSVAAAGTAGRSGVMALLGPSFTVSVDISGPVGEKFDTLQLVDIDGDGFLDVVTSEQNAPRLGLVWYRNPWGS